jgi:hypothetical protein
MTKFDFEKVLLAYLQQREPQLGAVRVTSFDDYFQTFDRGGCDTCGHTYETEFQIYIRYVDSNKRGSTHTVNSNWQSFLSDLVDLEID